MRTFNFAILWTGVFLLFSLPVAATHEKAPDPEEALELLSKKKKIEKEQLQRLSRMVLIPEGTFMMGRASANPHEGPPHEVFVDAFYIDKYEVTQHQYMEAFHENPSYFHDCPLCPVEKVTYTQAHNYCAKKGKRLPTEAEWEKAARGGVDKGFYWKHDVVDFFAWYGNNSGRKTQPVGERKPNAYGLHDMAGNVWEWVRDWYQPDSYSASTPKNPQGPIKGTHKVIRGGSWGDPPAHLAHAYRDSREPDTRYINVGFRCVSRIRPN